MSQMRLADIFHPHDLTLVIVSVSVAVLAAYASLELAGRIRASSGWVRWLWLVTGAISLGGGIWSMHFIGMLALILPVPVTYDLPLTALSFLIPIVFAAVGYYIVYWRSESWPRLLLGGVVIGTAIATMHYTGMAALRMPAIASYELPWVATSVVIAIAASTVALWLAFISQTAIIRFCGSSMGVAISGMHYTGVAGFICTPIQGRYFPLTGLSPTGLAPWVSGVSLILLWQILAFAAYNRRVERFTQEAAVQAALTTARSELAQVARLMMMGELTALIAHEINQPLGAIVTGANACRRWLAQKPPNIEEALELIDCIVRDGDRASEVIKRIRTFVRRKEPKRAPFDINDTIHQVLALARSEIEGRQVTVRAELTTPLPPAVGDKVEVEQVVLNLVINAIEAMADVRNRELLARSQLDDSGHVLVSVQDTGSELSENDYDHLFDAFVTTKPEGMGLGLSISRSIIEAHGGRLWASPISPIGSVFQFTLPIETAGAA
jgi:NO-binding membrane sensor protein with MHYT domain